MVELLNWMIASSVLSVLLSAVYIQFKRLGVGAEDRFRLLKFGLTLLTILTFIPWTTLLEPAPKTTILNPLSLSNTVVSTTISRSESIGFFDYLAMAIIALYGFLAVFSLIKYMKSLVSLWSLKRKCRKVSNFQGVEILIHGENIPPATIGIFHPVIMLNQKTYIELSETEKDLVFTHEMYHIRRHDFLVNQCAILLKIVLIYSPFIHWLVNRLQEDMELSCDDEVRRANPFESIRYGELLIRLAARISSKNEFVYSGLFASEKFISRRILEMRNPVQYMNIKLVLIACITFTGFSIPTLIATGTNKISSINIPYQKEKIDLAYNFKSLMNDKTFETTGSISVKPGDEITIKRANPNFTLRTTYINKNIKISTKILGANGKTISGLQSVTIEPEGTAKIEMGNDNKRIFLQIKHLKNLDRSN